MNREEVDQYMKTVHPDMEAIIVHHADKGQVILEVREQSMLIYDVSQGAIGITPLPPADVDAFMSYSLLHAHRIEEIHDDIEEMIEEVGVKRPDETDQSIVTAAVYAIYSIRSIYNAGKARENLIRESFTQN